MDPKTQDKVDRTVTADVKIGDQTLFPPRQRGLGRGSRGDHEDRVEASGDDKSGLPSPRSSAARWVLHAEPESTRWLLGSPTVLPLFQGLVGSGQMWFILSSISFHEIGSSEFFLDQDILLYFRVYKEMVFK